MDKLNSSKTDKNIVIYDGDCLLCNTTANFLHKRVINSELNFIPSKSDDGKDYIEKYNLHSIVNETIVLICKNVVYTKSNALLEIINFMHPKYKFLNVIRILPVSTRDWIYNIISKNRKMIKSKRKMELLNEIK